MRRDVAESRVVCATVLAAMFTVIGRSDVGTGTDRPSCRWPG